MANPVWPTTLPQNVLLNGYQETFPDNTIRVSMGTGPSKTRKRTSVNVAPFSCQLLLTSAEVDILKTFYTDDCADSALPFDWEHLRTGVFATYKFIGPPVITSTSSLFTATFGLELQP